MAEPFRIPVDNEYLNVLGRAFYNFTYLEWIVIWTIVKLDNNSWHNVPKGKPAGAIAKAFIKKIENPSIVITNNLRVKLIKFHENFLKAIEDRNKLLHGHPYTATDGKQQLQGGGLQWPIETVLQIARNFEDIAITGNDLFHTYLNK